MRSATHENRRWAPSAVSSLLELGLVLAALLLACERSPYRSGERDAGTIYMEACLPCHTGVRRGHC